MPQYDIVILGAGASGLWAAMTAAGRGKSVCVIDHGKRAGRKVLIAGGGKCNFTNLRLTPGDFVCANPHFVKSALARLTPWDLVAFLERHDIPWEEREHGQLFCRESAADVVSALESECRRAQVTLRLGEEIRAVKKKDHFHVTLGRGEVTATSCLIALGGPAWPQAGATDTGHHIAKQFGHTIIPARPALVPFTLPSDWPLRGLTGIALPVAITVDGARFTENLLFTHKGVSGPVVLQASCRWEKGMALAMDFLPETPLDALFDRAGGKPQVRTVLARVLPERLVIALLPPKLATKQVAQLTRKDHDLLTRLVHTYTVTPAGTEGMRKAESTAGGVDTADVSSKTMESRLTPGLYLTGEVLDVTGQLGGFNLHWAWASGQAAGEAM
ncbi:BaiN/RdsA family NAD(P)/FAD-dependent oxidoreductase [Desulfoluna spongiiphila]|uniref:NAD(P)/FAD-dependent oxidoreductase n=1 Tax=Desulfoluna spongiiphila TaxID=419481 RepID=UPI001252896E|nr:NAD(P)/FAD-dependent oxidoreductase [Desulfoluna spongiiphila]VVS91923.1 pyridine nucleotide disulphide reductase class-i signature [Desulfoluna spongiiphila]